MPIRTLLLLLPVLAFPAFAQDLPSDAKDLERKGVEAKQNRNFEQARDYLKQAAELGLYQAQVDYAFLLETGPPGVQDLVEAFGWYSVIATHKDSEFAREAQSRVRAKIPAADRKRMEDHAQDLVNQFGL